MLAALDRGIEVYLFLAGMMALAAYAQLTGIFDWMAERAIRIAGSSRARLFALVYAAGIATTALLSNDATIVALTPAVIGALRRFDAQPVPYVVACALVANAASFVLPISNPSNLLVFAGAMPPLATWLATFALPSCAALAVTYAVLRWFYRRELRGRAAAADASASVAPEPVATLLVAASAAAMIATSAFGGPLGSVTFACGASVALVTVLRDRANASAILRGISWRIIALTAALFVLVTALDDAGGFGASRAVFAWCAHLAAPWSTLAAGFAVAAASNAINNLPVGLNLGETLSAVHANVHFSAAALVGVNLGPNATVNGSLATLLWLGIVRRANIAVSPAAFARIGLLTTIPALAAALLWIHVP